MPDNTPLKDGNNLTFTAATDELADGSMSPKVTLLAGDGTNTGIAPATRNLQETHSALIGALAETAPGTDTGTSGLNGRLQRVAQRITSLMALLPGSLGGKTQANSLAVTIATDDPVIARMGEVTASPVANTLLARTKDIKDAIDNGTVAVGSVAAPSPDILTTVNVRPASATLGSLASAAASAQLLAANASRLGLVVHNTDANALFLKYGTTASTTSYTVKIPSDGHWEMPAPTYTGRIDAIWAADGSGSAFYTES
jgi:hypothetical protein